MSNHTTPVTCAPSSEPEASDPDPTWSKFWDENDDILTVRPVDSRQSRSHHAADHSSLILEHDLFCPEDSLGDTLDPVSSVDNTLDTLMELGPPPAASNTIPISPFYIGGSGNDNENDDDIIEFGNGGCGNLLPSATNDGGWRRTAVLRGDSALRRRVQVTIMGKGSGGSEDNGKRSARALEQINIGNTESVFGGGKRKDVGKRKEGTRSKKLKTAVGVYGKKNKKERKRYCTDDGDLECGKVRRAIFDYESGCFGDERNGGSFDVSGCKAGETLTMMNVDQTPWINEDYYDVSLDVVRNNKRNCNRGNGLANGITKSGRMRMMRKNCLSLALQTRLQAVIEAAAAASPVRSDEDGSDKGSITSCSLPETACAIEAVERAARNYSSILGKNKEIAADEFLLDAEKNGSEEERKGKKEGSKDNEEDGCPDPAISALQRYLQSPIRRVGGRRRIIAPQ